MCAQRSTVKHDTRRPTFRHRDNARGAASRKTIIASRAARKSLHALQSPSQVSPSSPLVDDRTKRIWALFRRFDMNGDEMLSREEAMGIFKRVDPYHFSETVVDPILEEMDIKRTGHLNMHEFVAWVLNDDLDWSDAREAVQLEGHRIFKTSDLIRFKSGRVVDFYDVIPDPRKASSLHLAINKESRKEYVVRTVRLNSAKQDSLQQEISAMQEIDHPNVVRLYEVFKDATRIYLILERCDGGEVFQTVCDQVHFTERQAATLMQQILSGVQHIHSRALCVGNLNCENLAFKTKPSIIEEGVVKIVDFGKARKCDAEQELQVRGLAVKDGWYSAPETFQGIRSQASDMWACGVMMYLLLSGYPPFCCEAFELEELADFILDTKLSFPEADWRHVSGAAKNLIELLIQREPKYRYNAAQALRHPWISQEASTFLSAPLHPDRAKFKDFCKHNSFKKAALHVVASHLSEDEIDDLRKMFLAMDKNRDSTITFFELKSGLEDLRMPETAKSLRTLMQELDVDGNLRISYTEFLAAAMDKSYAVREDTCWEAFRVFDVDNSGQIARAELKRVLQETSVQGAVGSSKISNVSQILSKWDSDRDGKIGFEEFMLMMRGAESDLGCD